MALTMFKSQNGADVQKTEQQTEENGLVSLADAAVGIPLKVKRIDAGRDAYGRLIAMGVLIDTEISIVQRYQNGPLVLSVRGTRIAIGRGLSLKVMVSEVKKDDDEG